MKKSILLSLVLVGVLSAGVMDKVKSASPVLKDQIPTQLKNEIFDLKHANDHENWITEIKTIEGKEVAVEREWKKPEVINDKRWLNIMSDSDTRVITMVLDVPALKQLEHKMPSFSIDCNEPPKKGEAYKNEVIKSEIIGLTDNQSNTKDILKKMKKDLVKEKRGFADKIKTKVEKLLGENIEGDGIIYSVKLTKREIEILEKSGLVKGIIKPTSKKILDDMYLYVANYNNFKSGMYNFNDNGYGGENVTIGINEFQDVIDDLSISDINERDALVDEMVVPHNYQLVSDPYADVGYTNGIGLVLDQGGAPKYYSHHASHVGASMRLSAPEANLYFIRNLYTKGNIDFINIVNRSWGESTPTQLYYNDDSKLVDEGQNFDRHLSIFGAGNECDEGYTNCCNVSGIALSKNAITVGWMIGLNGKQLTTRCKNLKLLLMVSLILMESLIQEMNSMVQAIHLHL